MSGLAKIQPKDLSVRILKSSNDISGFDCSHEDELGLNEFIHKEAIDYQNECLGVTHLFLYQNNVVGYATIAMHALEVKLTRLRMPFFTTIKHYPALLIGRLAVDNQYRGRGIGRNICLWCLGKAKELTKEVGCRLVVVMTTQAKVGFYKNCGFLTCAKYEKKQRVFMYLPIF